MKKKRVVVTGLSVVSCFGTDVDKFFDSLLIGKSGIKPITYFDCCEYPTRFAGELSDFNFENYLDKKRARRVDPFIGYTMVAGKKGLEDALLIGKSFENLEKDRCGVLVGSGMGGMSVFHTGSETLINKGFKRITPFFVPYIITNMGGALLAIDVGFLGPNYSISTACATSNYCIISAASHIQNGEADVMICGGAEAPINPIGVSGFVACRAISERNDAYEKASRPWDKDRDGFVIGEGCGVLILEELEHAKKRGAKIYAEYLGGAVSCDAYHMTEPKEDGAGVVLWLEKLLKNANINYKDIDYVNAHATSTVSGDICEIRGIKKVLKDHIYNTKINSTKSMIGHCLGAAGAIEAVATIKSIEKSVVHPTINLENREKETEGLNFVENVAQKGEIKCAISNSFGFGGHNSAVAFGKYCG